jgi:hypothetical protein
MDGWMDDSKRKKDYWGPPLYITCHKVWRPAPKIYLLVTAHCRSTKWQPKTKKGSEFISDTQECKGLSILFVILISICTGSSKESKVGYEAVWGSYFIVKRIAYIDRHRPWFVVHLPCRYNRSSVAGLPHKQDPLTTQSKVNRWFQGPSCRVFSFLPLLHALRKPISWIPRDNAVPLCPLYQVS